MNKRLLLINGMAILAVVVSHAAGWGQGVMTSAKWQGIFQDMGLNGYDSFPGPAYFILTALRMTSTFAVPSFFFVTGFFMAFANRGAHAKLTYSMVFLRIRHIFIPYTFWSILIFAAEYLIFHRQYTPLEYIWVFLSFGAAIHYYYVPTLAVFYLFTPLLIPFIRSHKKPALLIAAGVQFALLFVNWMTTYGYWVVKLPSPFSTAPWFPSWWVSRWVFFGTLGIICGFVPERFTAFLERNKRMNVMGVCVSLVCLLALEIMARLSGAPVDEFLARCVEQVYAVFFICAGLALRLEDLPFAPALNWVSARIFGIYLLHFTVLSYLAHALGVVAPGILAYQIVFQVILVAAGLGFPLLFMYFISKTPLRRHYRQLFG